LVAFQVTTLGSQATARIDAISIRYEERVPAYVVRTSAGAPGATVETGK
jgi:hypothetical protein